MKTNLTSPFGTPVHRTSNKVNWQLFWRNPLTGKRTFVLEHRWLWVQAYGPIPEGYVIHHRDRNGLNNDLGNLECVSRKKHAYVHGITKTVSEHKDSERFSISYRRMCVKQRFERTRSDPEKYAKLLERQKLASQRYYLRKKTSNYLAGTSSARTPI